MYKHFTWIAVGLLALTVGCKGEQPGTGDASATGGSSKNTSTATSNAAAGVTPDVAMSKLAKDVSTGNLVAIWDALPPKYQTDVTEVKNAFAANMDAEVWNKAFGLVGKLVTVLKTKKEFILGSEMTKGAPADQRAKAEANWDSMVGFLETLSTSEIKTIDGLKQADVGHFLSTTGSSLAKTALAAMPIADQKTADAVKMAGETKFELVSVEGDKATVKVQSPDEPAATEESFTKVDGKWLPTEVVNDWDEKMAQAKAEMASYAIPAEVKTEVVKTIGDVDQVLDKLAAAKDQAAFDAELQTAFFQMLPIIGKVMGGGGAPGMSGPPADFGAPGGAPPSGTGTTPAITPPNITPPSITPPKVDPPKANP